jgi:hypothetical protein
VLSLSKHTNDTPAPPVSDEDDIKNVDLDFGDAPDPTYPTLLASNGARHIILPGFMLGSFIDAELDGQPDPLALGDDNNPIGMPDDEACVEPVETTA